MNCPPLEELTFDHPHLDTCDRCSALCLLRSGSRPDPAGCDDVSTLLPLYADAVLSDDDQVLVDEHLSRCPACTRAVFSDDIIGDDVSPSATHQTWSSPKDVEDELAKRRSRIPMVVSLFVAAAVLLILLRWQPWQADPPGLVADEDSPPREAIDTPIFVDAGVPDAPTLPLQPDSEHIANVLSSAQPAVEACMKAHRMTRRVATENTVNILPNGTLEVGRWAPVKPSAEFQACVVEARAPLRFERSQRGVSLKCTFRYRRSQATHRCEELPWPADNDPR